MFKKLFTKIVGDPTQKLLDGMQPVIDEAAALEADLMEKSDEELRGYTAVFKERLANGEELDGLLPEVCALVREASRRAIGHRHYDVQLVGGILLHQGDVIEMRTGEGKTLVGTVPLYLNALMGRGVQLVTVNDYLVRRDGGWMGNVFHFLGMTLGCIGGQGFSALFDPDYVNPGAELEDERLVHWRPCTRKQAYLADITYGTSSEFGFDYLRDNMVTQPERLVQREHYYAIIDEVDNVLIDEARTPLIISGPADRMGKEYARFSEYVRRLRRNTADEEADPNGHYDLDEKSRSISLTEIGIAEIEKRIEEIDTDVGASLYDPQYYHLTYYLDNALKAEYLFKRDVQYIVQEGQVIIIDDFTGRPMPGRRYSDGLHEAIEAKEKVAVKRETTTVATITLQNYFRLYEKLGGMTGTAVTDAEEFDKIYELGVTPLPTNVQYIVDQDVMPLQERRQKVENAEEIAYLDPATKKPKFFKRTDYPDQVYGTEGAKDKAIVSEIRRIHEQGRPVLVGTTSVEHSEIIHHLLQKEQIQHKVLNAKIHQSEALIVAQAGRKKAVTISTNMAGRGTDILLGGNPEGLAAEALETELFDRPLLTQLARTLVAEGEESARQSAQKHAKLSEDLVDDLLRVQTQFDEAMTFIEKEQVIGYLSRTLQEPYDIDYNHLRNVLRLVRGGQLGEARDYLDQIDKDVALVDDVVRQWDIYTQYQTVHGDEQRKAQFLAEMVFERNYNGRAALIRAVLGGELEEAKQIAQTVPGLSLAVIDRIQQLQAQAQTERTEVWDLGGLHVIGSERHESRRIDNQLRGRAARQGDPGSSRFFLSLEDELMRRFGGERLKSFMSRTNIPDDMPIEAKVLDRLIESSQERLEGFNFDMRKNIVEYDDVMTLQRQAIYDERRTILLGEATDLDEKLSEAFANSIAELVDNYVVNYRGYVRGEVERIISDFSTDATDTINVYGIVRQLRGLLPAVVELERADLATLSADELVDEFMELAHEHEEDGHNLLQLLQAMGRFLPLLPPIPNLASLARRKGGQLQAKEVIRREFLQQVETLFNDFLAEYIEQAERDDIWQKASGELDKAISQFSLDGLSVKTAESRQVRFHEAASHTLRNLLLESLSALDGEQLVLALNGYVQKQRQQWRERIGEEEYGNFRRLLMLSAIDREWRDYLTAMDDLRREVGLSAIAQRDPKIEYKRRSYEMFQDMRRNIERDMVDRFFRQIIAHQAFIQQQEAEVAYKTNAQEAGYEVVKRGDGKRAQLKRATAKVGRNDPCPCGSGKKYKNCHMRQDQARAGGRTTTAVPTNGQTKTPVRPSKRKKKKSRRR